MESDNQIIKCKLDLEAGSTLLSKVLERENVDLQNHTGYKTPVGKMLLEREKERFSVYSKCKDNLDFVIDALKDYIGQENIKFQSAFTYKPRKIAYYEIGKYQTEVKRVNDLIKNVLLWRSTLLRDEEKMTLYQECITRLNYVYAHISKRM